LVMHLTFSSPLITLFCLFFFSRYAAHRDLPSFPTRRSSDLLKSKPRHHLQKTMAPSRVCACLGPRFTLAQGERVQTVLTIMKSRSEEHTSELQSLTISYAVFCLKKKKTNN